MTIFAFHSTDQRWRIPCQRPGCQAYLEGVGQTDREQKHDAVQLGERRGWQIAPHGVDVALCPMHVDLTLPHRLTVTRLYDDQLRPLPYKGGR